MKRIQQITWMALFLLPYFFTAGAQEKINNFSGTWLINIKKSDFGGAPLYTASKKLVILQTAKTLRIESIHLTDLNTDSTVTSTLSFSGEPFQVTREDKTTERSTIKWKIGGQILTETIHVSFENDPGTEKFLITDTWYLSDDGETLTMISVVTYNGGGYTVNAVYEKQ